MIAFSDVAFTDIGFGGVSLGENEQVIDTAVNAVYQEQADGKLWRLPLLQYFYDPGFYEDNTFYGSGDVITPA